MKSIFVLMAGMSSLVFGFRQPNIKKAEWLLGTWTNKGMYETWTKVSETGFSGKSYVLKGKDTLVFETIQLVEENDSLFYIPSVKNQNGGKPVRFALVTFTGDKMVFENPGHDFPQRISYQRKGENELLAEISGTTKKGRTRTESFPMKRLVLSK